MDLLIDAPDDFESKLYVQCENKNIKSWGTFGEEYKLEYRGYKEDFLLRKLSEMEREFTVCPTCKGIMREATASEGETTCLLCSKTQHNPNPVNQVRNSVGKLGVKCPLLRDCGWVGKLIDAEMHLKECDSFRIWCQLECGTVVKRCKMELHLKRECQLRKVQCEFCGIIVGYKELVSHSEMCFASPVECKCGNKCRRDMVSAHLGKECPLGEVTCPYRNHGCKAGAMPRKDLLAHKKDFYLEHQDLILAKLSESELPQTPQSAGKVNPNFTFLERSASENKDSESQRILVLEMQQIKLVKENHDMKVELNLLRAAMRAKKDLESLDWKIELEELTFAKELTSPIFYIHSYTFRCSMKVGVPCDFFITRMSGLTKASDKEEVYIGELRVIVGNNEFDSSAYFQEVCPGVKAVIGKTSNSLFSIPQNVFSKFSQSKSTITIFIYFDIRNYMGKERL